MRQWSVVIPVKRLAAAKTRLRGTLPGVPHRELVLCLAADTVTAALDCPAVAAVLVVTDDPAVRETVTRLGAQAIADVPDSGLNPALRYGAEQARRSLPDAGVVALGADLPALRPTELAGVLGAAARHPRAYVTDAERSGTVLLTAGPEAVLDPRFGAASALSHRVSGAVGLTGDWPSVRRDVDTAADLDEARALGLGRHTAALLGERGDTGNRRSRAG